MVKKMDTEKKIPKRLAVDFDNTLFHCLDFSNTSKVTCLNRIVHWYVRHKKKQGWFIIINTCREENKGLNMVRSMCDMYRIPYDAINEQEPTAEEVWGHSRKIACDLSIDDTQCGLLGFLLRRFG